MTFQGVSVDNLDHPTSLLIKLKKSNTDQFMDGATVPVGRMDGPLCPVRATLGWLVLRGNGPGSLFNYADGSPLTQSTFTNGLRKTLSDVGIDPKCYAGHSLRIGAATTAAIRGVGDAMIKRLGRWRVVAHIKCILRPRLRN